jgi:hypothetical protein
MPAAPKLTPLEWADVRSRWEADSREGYQWLVSEMNLPVSVQAVRKIAGKELWRKSGSMKSIIQRAHIRADAKAEKRAEDKREAEAAKVADEPSMKVTPTKVTPKVTQVTMGTETAVDLRSGIIDMHREDWEEHRQIFAMQAMVTDIDLGKAAKLAAEITKMRHEGERKAWGLDAIVEAESTVASDEELDRIYAAVMADSDKMAAIGEKQYQELRVVSVDGETVN